MSRRPAFVFFIMVVLGLLVYWNALQNPFQYDDRGVVAHNPHIRDMRNLSRFFYDPGVLSDDPAQRLHLRPLWMVSYALNYALGGLNPVGYHLVNLAFHIGSAFLVFLIVMSLAFKPMSARSHEVPRSRGYPFIPALAAGIIFLVHPFNSEVVNYILARSSVMCTFFYLLAFWCWVKYREPVSSFARALTYYIVTLLAFLAALLTKEVAVTFPIVLIAYDLYLFWSPRNGSWDWSYLLKREVATVPFLAILLIPFVARYFLMGEVLPQFRRTLATQFYTEVGVIVKYLRLFLIPAGLSVDHDINIYQGFWNGEVVFSTALLVVYLGLIIGLFLAGNRWQWVSFFLLFFLITLLPTTLIPLDALMQENRGYLPFAGLVIAVGIALGRLSSFPLLSFEKRISTISRITWISILILLLAGYSAATVKRNFVWKDPYTLWADAVRKSPGSPRAHANLAYLYSQRGEDLLAFQEYLEALRLNPVHAGLHNDVATYYYHRGQFAEAEYHLKASIAIRPDYYLAYSNLGLLYERLGRHQEAIQFYKKALELEPSFSIARARLERVLRSVK